MHEIKVGQKYKRTHGSYAGHVAEVTFVGTDIVYYKPGLYEDSGSWMVGDFLRDWVPVEEPKSEIIVGQKYQIVGGWTSPENEVVRVSNVSEDLVYTKPSVYGDVGNDEKKHFFPDFRAYEVSGEKLGYVLVEEEDNHLSPNEDSVNHPSHYTSDKSGVECIEITRHRNFNIGAAIKYLWRAGLKEDSSLDNLEKEIQDLEKAIFHIKDEIKRKRGE
jgi:hypothetical protein